jgi:signal transduction histidine kinase
LAQECDRIAARLQTTIKDRGPAIHAADLKHILEPLFGWSDKIERRLSRLEAAGAPPPPDAA